jgi:hypothetical protein
MTQRGLVTALITNTRRSKAEAERIMADVAGEILAASDDAAYRELADKVNDLLADTVGEQHDSAAWDGDESELEILARFIEWAPDLIVHAQAEALRVRYLLSRMPGVHRNALVIADDMDPFEKRPEDGGLAWYRKSDDRPAPLPVVVED